MRGELWTKSGGTYEYEKPRKLQIVSVVRAPMARNEQAGTAVQRTEQSQSSIPQLSVLAHLRSRSRQAQPANHFARLAEWLAPLNNAGRTFPRYDPGFFHVQLSNVTPDHSSFHCTLYLYQSSRHSTVLFTLISRLEAVFSGV